MSVTSKELFGLQRTFYPKYTHYASDGEGRDSYILNNNGGMCTEAQRPISWSTFYAKEKPRVVIPVAHKPTPSFKYISDGSGRDFYVTYNSGGLQAPYIPGTLKADAQFISSLRNTEKRNKLIRYNFPKEREMRKRSLINQKKMIERLTSKTKEWKKISKLNKQAFLKNRLCLPKREDSLDYGMNFGMLNNTISWPNAHSRHKSLNQIEKSPKESDYLDWAIDPFTDKVGKRLDLKPDYQIRKIPTFLKSKFTNNMIERKHSKVKSQDRYSRGLRLSCGKEEMLEKNPPVSSTKNVKSHSREVLRNRHKSIGLSKFPSVDW